MKKIIFILVLLVLVNGCFLNKTTDSTVICDGKRVSMSEGCIPDDGKNYLEEQINLKCVPAQCCHPTSCVFEKDAPDCKGVMCTMDCKPGTLDCGQGECKYIDGKCGAVIK